MRGPNPVRCASVLGMSKRTQALAVAVVLAAVLLACKKSDGTDGAGGKQGPIITKPFAELSKEDIGQTCVALGWSNSGVTFSSGAGSSNIMASCTKESPEGTPSPDGKKRLRMRVAVYTDPAAEVAGRKQRLESEGGAAEVQGNATLGVVVYDKPKSEAQQVLGKLLGK